MRESPGVAKRLRGFFVSVAVSPLTQMQQPATVLFMSTKSEVFAASTAMVIVLVVIFGVVWFKAAMEARSHNKFCDTPVTTWDAVWLDLRIDECG